jgi:asparagine synthase (glutamine-hydrolysing)
MCGIAGIYSRFKSPINEIHHDDVYILNEHIKRRGPDYNKIKQVGEYYLTAQSQLAIQDRHNINSQLPVKSACGRYILTYNGEIYNHYILRNMIPDYKFTSNSDSETLVALLSKFGIDIIEKLDGMWAFAFYDLVANELLLSRDEFGQKPLYWSDNSGYIYFCSEIKGLIYSISKEASFSEEAISEILVQRFNMSENTHIKNIHKVLPGQTLKFNQASIIDSSIKLTWANKKNIEDILNASNLIEQSLLNSVDLLSNVNENIGVFLSSGIDSSAIATILNNKTSVHAFTFSFVDNSNDNKNIVDEYADTLNFCKSKNIKLDRILVNSSQYYEELKKWIIDIGDLPSFPNDCVPLRLLAKEASNHVRIIFTGAGADELFDGYSTDTSENFGQFFDQLKFDSLKELAFQYIRSWSRFNSIDLEVFWNYKDINNKIVENYNRILNNYKDKDLSNSELVRILMLKVRLDGFELPQIDRACMSYGIESRSPFISKEVIATSLGYKNEWYYSEGPKTLLKKALSNILPKNFMTRPKLAFPIPTSYYFGKDFDMFIEPVLESGSILDKLGLIKLEVIRKMSSDDQKSCRSLISRLAFIERLLIEHSNVSKKSI